MKLPERTVVAITEIIVALAPGNVSAITGWIPLSVWGSRGGDLMTVAGAVAGNVIGKRVKSTESHEITARFEDGSTPVLNEAGATASNSGVRVQVVNGHIQPDARAAAEALTARSTRRTGWRVRSNG